jgi:hypothetical protein
MSRWIIAGSGPSLTPAVAEQLREQRVIAVNDAYKLLPFAVALYAADADWWDHNQGAQDFAGEKWSCWTVAHEIQARKRIAKAWGVKLISGYRGAVFSKDPSRVAYGLHSGFQATGIAIHRGASFIVLVGFDMRGTHFFGEHQRPLRQRPSFGKWISVWEQAMRSLPQGLRIVNATPGSALLPVPYMDLGEALRD